MRHYCRLHKRNYEADKDESCPWCRIEALEAAIGNINTQKEIVLKYAKESDRLMAVGKMYQAIAEAAALLPGRGE